MPVAFRKSDFRVEERKDVRGSEYLPVVVTDQIATMAKVGGQMRRRLELSGYWIFFLVAAFAVVRIWSPSYSVIWQALSGY